MFADLLKIMPNVRSISLSTFNLWADFVSLRPDSLAANRTIMALELCKWSLRAEEFIKLIRLSSACLEVLLITGLGPLRREAYEAIGDCTNLRRLVIDGDHSFIDDRLKKILLHNPGLETLELRGCASISDEGLAPVHRLRNFRKLTFTYCTSLLSERFLRSLGTIPSLLDVEFQDVMFGGRRSHDVRVLRSIASLPNLRTWRAKCNDLDSACLKVILEDFKNLRALTLRDCSKLTESDFVMLRQFTQLRSLALSNARELTDFALEGGLGSSALESLSLADCPLTDGGLAAIKAHHSRLRRFSLMGCGGTTVPGLVVLLQHEPLLEELVIWGIFVTEEFFGALKELCPRLRQLHCSVGPWVNNSVLESFRTERPAVDLHRMHFGVQ